MNDPLSHIKLNYYTVHKTCILNNCNNGSNQEVQVAGCSLEDRSDFKNVTLKYLVKPYTEQICTLFICEIINFWGKIAKLMAWAVITFSKIDIQCRKNIMLSAVINVRTVSYSKSCAGRRLMKEITQYTGRKIIIITLHFTLYWRLLLSCISAKTLTLLLHRCEKTSTQYCLIIFYACFHLNRLC